MSTRPVRRVLVSLAATTLMAGVAVLPSTMVPAGAAPVTKAFAFSGSAQSFTVPEGVTSLTIEVLGAAGGNGEAYPTNPDCVTGFGAGAAGGRALATIAVTPGQVLQINVGGRGEDAVAFDSTTPLGGFNGGGDGGSGDSNGYGGGGGGASDIRTGGTALADRAVVAGGGGGGGACVGGPGADGGAGGGTTGTDGDDTADCDGGGGGTATAGGIGGTNCATGTDGAAGQGGVGGESGAAGGGGGGGYFGGGGGAGGAGGGGGSGVGPAGVTMANGVQAGDGQVTITYEGAAAVTTTTTPRAPTPVRVAPKFTG